MSEDRGVLRGGLNDVELQHTPYVRRDLTGDRDVDIDHSHDA